MNTNLVASVVVVASLGLAACGGSGGSSSNSDNDGRITYSGSTSQASVGAGNAEDLAVAASGGTNQAIASNAANSANPLSPRGIATQSSLTAKLIELVEQSITSGQRIAGQLLPLCDSGTADLDQNSDGTSGTIVFTDCLVTLGNGEVVNGNVDFSATISGITITSLDMEFIDFTVDYLGQTQPVNLTVSCSGSPLVCNLFSDFVGFDGRIYRVEVTAVTNTAGNTFDVDATVFDPDHGFTTIDADVTYNNCVGGVPESGSITVTGAAATNASVVFNDCDSFTITHMGVPTVYFWADIL